MSYLYLIFLIIPTFWIISLIFLCLPNIIWKKHKRPWQQFNILSQSNKVYCIGHRGGARQGAENTMECFTSTDKFCNMFELDVVETKCKQLVVHHDLSLSRTCGVNREVAQLNYEELPHFQASFDMHFTSQKGKGNKNKIILLRDLFQKFPQKPMNIELKSPTESATKEFARLVSQFDREHITVWGVVRDDGGKLRATNQNVEHFFNISSILKVYALYIFGLLPFWRLDYGFFEIPMFRGEFFEWIQRIRGNGGCLICLARCLICCINSINGPLIRHLKGRGILTFCFVLNNQQDYEYVVEKGCSGIMTDRPSHLMAFLQKKGLHVD